MSGEKHGRGVEQACEMIAVFSSLGVGAFDVTETDLDGQKRRFRPARYDELLKHLPQWLAAAATRRQNLIVRPRGGRATLVQLDDLSEARLQRVSNSSFLILCTSPGNHQAWVAIEDSVPDFARCLRRGSGADPSASGAARIAGSLNFKRKYAPNFPMVTLVKASARITTRAELVALGLVSPSDPQLARSTPRPRVSMQRMPAWPSYPRCLCNAPPAHGTNRPDRSRADFTFCLLAIDWGRSIAETAERLAQLSPKARQNGESYAWRTTLRAAAAVARRRRVSYADANAASDLSPASKPW